MYRFNPIDSRRKLLELQREQEKVRLQIANEQQRLQAYQRIPPQVLIAHQNGYIQELERRINQIEHQNNSNYLNERVHMFQNQTLDEIDLDDKPRTSAQITNNLHEKMMEFNKRRNHHNIHQESKPPVSEPKKDGPTMLDEYYFEEAEIYRKSNKKDEYNQIFPKSKDPQVEEFNNHISKFESEPECTPHAHVVDGESDLTLNIGDQAFDMSDVIDALAMYYGQEESIIPHL